MEKVVFKARAWPYYGAVAALLVACGIIPVGGGTLNDPVPSGTVTYSGTFTGLGTNTASGTASIYNQSPGTYVLRLDGLNVPSQSNLNVVLTGSGTTWVNTSLRGTTGSQNYNFTASTNVFDTSTIHSTSSNTDIASAPLHSTGNTPPVNNTN